MPLEPKKPTDDKDKAADERDRAERRIRARNRKGGAGYDPTDDDPADVSDSYDHTFTQSFVNRVFEAIMVSDRRTDQFVSGKGKSVGRDPHTGLPRRPAPTIDNQPIDPDTDGATSRNDPELNKYTRKSLASKIKDIRQGKYLGVKAQGLSVPTRRGFGDDPDEPVQIKNSKFTRRRSPSGREV